MDASAIEGTIAVTGYEEEAIDVSAEGGPTVKELRITETFAGGIQGDGKVRFLQSLRADGSATFCGTERVAGTIDGRRGTFLLQDQGELATDGKVRGTWFVVPGSATGELAGLRGEGGFEAQLGQHAHYHLEVWSE